MFEKRDVVQIRTSAKDWKRAFGNGVYDVVLKVVDPKHRGCVVAEVIYDPHNSFADRSDVKNGKIRVYEQDLFSRKEMREELLSIKGEIGV